ncbi:MAG TPA: phosphoglycerate mutase family protein [Bacteroidia bacterium]|nr:phosphoglycerate mutase family protein [Bacteroidia bacterium]
MVKGFKFLFLISIVLLVYSCQSTIYLVRHAEKQSEADAALLSEIGLQRAQRLKNWMFDKHIDSVFASTYVRTQQTAQPTATYYRKSLTIYHPDTSALLVHNLSRLSKTCLIVGHTTNIPVMIRELTQHHISIGLNEFSNIYILKTKRCLFKKRTTLQVAHFE